MSAFTCTTGCGYTGPEKNRCASCPTPPASPVGPLELDYEEAGRDALLRGFEFDAAHVGEGCRKPLDKQFLAALAQRERETVERIVKAIRSRFAIPEGYIPSGLINPAEEHWLRCADFIEAEWRKR